jgi:hypothetical protein
LKNKSKYSGYWQAFNANWFRNNQKKILSWVNGGWLKRKISRYALRLDTKEDLMEIGPSYYKVGLPDGQIQASFRTHDKYSKRVYYSLFLFWWALHFIDWLLLDRFVPKYSFGFTVLTAYPQAGHGGSNTTCDTGFWCYIVGSTFATLRGSGTCSTIGIDNSYGTCAGLYCSATASRFDSLFRGGFTLDTSALGATSTITAASFYLCAIQNGASGGSNPYVAPYSNINLVSLTPTYNANSLATQDYSALGTTSYSSVTVVNFVDDGTTYTEMVLDANGLATISKTSITSFGTKLQGDVVNRTPTYLANAQLYYNVYFADNTGTAKDPKLVVTYTAGATTTYKQPAILVG